MIGLGNILARGAAALYPFLPIIDVAIGFFFGQRQAKKYVRALEKRYEKIVGERVAEIQGNFDRVLKEHEEDFRWIQFQKSDFAYYMQGNKSAAKKLAEAISNGAGLKAKNSILEESLRLTQQEITLLKTTKSEQTNTQILAQQNINNAEIMTVPEIIDNRILSLEGEIKKLRERLQTSEDETRTLRNKNMDLVGIIREKKLDISEPKEGVPVDEESGADATIQATELAQTEDSRDDDARVMWRLNGRLTTIPIPKNLAELKPWVDTYLANKVILTPKALRAAEKAKNYQDVALVYKALLLLGARRDMIVEGGMEHKKYFDDQLKALHLECATAIRPAGLGRIKDGQYHTYWNRQKFVTTMAIKRDNARDPTRVLRIYFADNEPDRNIIVGHLPTHLGNRFS